LRRQVQQAIDENASAVEKDDGLPRTIFHSLLNSDLPASDKTVERLRQEGQLVVGAGSDTVANTLAVTTFHILDNPEKLAKLVEELEKAIPDPNEPAKLSVVEQLPYLVSDVFLFSKTLQLMPAQSGVIQEGLRYVIYLT
jgi:cytochrome P450